MAEIEEVARELALLVRGLKGLHRDTLASAGLRLELPAAGVLVLLEEHGPLRASQVAELLHLDLSSVSRQVATLERDGRLSRQRDPADQRAALLDLTPGGRQVLAQVRTSRLDQLAARLPGWSSDELRALAVQLRRLRTDLLRPLDPPLADAPDPTPAPAGTTPALAGKEN